MDVGSPMRGWYHTQCLRWSPWGERSPCNVAIACHWPVNASLSSGVSARLRKAVRALGVVVPDRLRSGLHCALFARPCGWMPCALSVFVLAPPLSCLNTGLGPPAPPGHVWTWDSGLGCSARSPPGSPMSFDRDSGWVWRLGRPFSNKQIILARIANKVFKTSTVFRRTQSWPLCQVCRLPHCGHYGPVNLLFDSPAERHKFDTLSI